MTRHRRKISVVTGGGSGIGRALARALAVQGASVVVADILEENAQAVTQRDPRAGGSALAVVCDVSDRASVRDTKAKANAAFGAISLLFANAGVTSVERLTASFRGRLRLDHRGQPASACPTVCRPFFRT